MSLLIPSFIIFFSSGVLLHYPLYVEAVFAKGNFNVEALLSSIHHTLRMLVLDGELDRIREYSYTLNEPLATSYFLLSALVYIISPLLTFGAVLSIFKNVSALVRYYTHFFSETCIFSELNERALILAESIKENHPKTLIVFTDVYEETGEVSGELQYVARKLGAVCLKNDIAVLPISFHKKTNRIRLFIIGGDEDENIRQASQLIQCHGENANMHLYLFSNSAESSLLVQSKPASGMKIRRIDEVKSLISETLYEAGADIFRTATPLENDEKLISIVILGLGVYGTELLKSLSWFGQMENYRLMLTAIDSRENAESVFSFQCPELMDEKHNGTYETGEAQYTISIHSGINAMSERCIQIIKELPSVSYVFVALGNDQKNVECAVSIRERCERMNRHPKIKAIVFNDNVANVLSNAVNFRGVPYDIQYIGNLKRQYSETALLNSQLESEALKRHLQWGTEDAFWNCEFNYRSSVASVIHQRVKLQCNIPGVNQNPNERNPADRDRLRLIEHRRWNAYMRAEGYSIVGPELIRIADIGKIGMDYTALTMKEMEIDYLCIPSDRYEMNDETEGTFDDWKQSAKEYENDTSILLVKNDEVIGYCDMYPVMEEAYNDLITGKVIIRDSMIDLFCMGGVFDVYIAMVGIVPEEATQANYLIIFDWIFEHLDEWSENDINVDHVGISVYSDMLEKFIKRFGFEYKGLNPAKGKVYEATIKALKHNSLVKKRYPHFCQKDSLDPDE